MYVVFTRSPGESYCRRFRSLLLSLFDVFRELIINIVLFQIVSRVIMIVTLGFHELCLFALMI